MCGFVELSEEEYNQIMSEFTNNLSGVSKEAIEEEYKNGRRTFSSIIFDRLDLKNINLSGCSFYDSSFSFSDLKGANLSGCDFKYASLDNANLEGADLSKSWLEKASLDRIRAKNANLSGTCLDPHAELPVIHDSFLDEAGFTVCPSKEHVIGYRTLRSQFYGEAIYKPRKTPYVASYFSASTIDSCHPGIYIASISYLLNHFQNEAWVKCYCLRNELIHVGGKSRCKRLWVVEKLSPKQKSKHINNGW